MSRQMNTQIFQVEDVAIWGGEGALEARYDEKFR